MRTGGICQKWDMVVTTGLPNTTVSISTPDLSGIPGDYSVVLSDQATGHKAYLRTSTGYSFSTNDSGAVRKLSLEIVPRSQAVLMGMVNVQSANGQGAVITYGLNGAAAVTAEVRNISGRLVKQVATDRVETAGNHSLVWTSAATAGPWCPGACTWWSWRRAAMTDSKCGSCGRCRSTVKKGATV